MSAGSGAAQRLAHDFVSDCITAAAGPFLTWICYQVNILSIKTSTNGVERTAQMASAAQTSCERRRGAAAMKIQTSAL
jgi:hypothetical protein